MELINTVLILLATLAVLVAVHEFGHFWVARRCGVKVLRFSIGFGPALYSWRDRLGTQYSIAAIPLGGYVKMLDEREGEVSADERSQAFTQKPVLSRIAIVAAGPLANFLLAIAAYWFLYLSGESGYVPVVDKVEAGSIAERAGLEPGQEIVAVDGGETPTWQALSFRLIERIGDTGTLTFSVKYPDSDAIQETGASIDRWLSDQDEPDIFGGLGLTLYLPDIVPVISEVLPDSPASTGGLQAGDKVIAADGTPMPVWDDWLEHVRARPGQAIALEYEREGSLYTVTLVPEAFTLGSGEVIGRVGVKPSLAPMPDHLVRQFSRGPLESLGASLQRTADLTVFTLSTIKKMLQGLVSPKNLSGPITIAKVASSSAKSGLESYIGFLALLSVSLGVLNLLPIPVLDGGHLLFYTVELVAGRPVPERIQVFGYQVGLFLVMGIMMFALYNDFTRL